MAGKEWGHCKDCKHFATSKTNPAERDEAECRQPELTKYDLRVSGGSGCNAFEARKEATTAPPAP